MFKLNKLLLSLSISLIAFPSFLFADEILTISTYYPSPYGSYKELRAYRMKIGSTYSTTTMTDSDNGKLIVEGPVGIGTTAPSEKLDVMGYINANSVMGGASYKIGTWGIVGSSMWQAMFGGIGGTPGHQFTNIGLFTSGSEKVRIDTNGNVGIGTTGPTHLIHLSGGAYCDGTGAWIAGSDRAYKKDIDYDFKYGLKEVEQLKPVYYVHKKDKDNKKQVGFIAQDVLKVIPELVSGDDGALGLSYGQLTAVLVKAVQEQQKAIRAQQQQIEDLKQEVTKLSTNKSS